MESYRSYTYPHNNARIWPVGALQMIFIVKTGFWYKATYWLVEEPTITRVTA